MTPRLPILAALLLLSSACAGPKAAGPEPSEATGAPAEGATAGEAGETGETGEASASAAGEAGETGEAGEAEAPTPTGERVQLDFDWPEEAALPVALDVERVRDGPAGRQTERAKLTYTLEVEPTEEGLSVASRDVKVIEAIGSEADLTALMAQIPTLVVSKTGDVLAVRDAAATVDAALAAADVPEALAENLRSQLTNALEAGAVDWWNGLVGLWAGGEIEIGRTYTESVEEALPVLGIPVTVRVSYRAEARVPCEEGGDPEACLRLRVLSSPDAEVVAEALKAWTERTAELPPGTAPRIEDLTSHAEVVLVTEPETLRPHRLERVRVIEVAFEGPAGGVQTQKGINRSTYRFE